jgi:hypothetical protein
MGTRHSYKGFIIEAFPYQLRDIPGWRLEFYIEQHDDSGVTVTRFYFEKPDIFETREAAIQTAIAAGREKIDAGFTASAAQAITA